MVLTLIAEAGGLSVLLYAGVAWLKQLGVKGKWLTICSMVFGIALGLGVRYAETPLIGFAAWFWSAIFGFVCGLIASGVYKAQDGLVAKSAKMQ